MNRDEYVEFPARASLHDNGCRPWNEVVQEDLDRRYPGWREPTKTILIHRQFKNDAGGLAEKRIFDLLGEMGNVKGKEEPMFVIPSYHFHELLEESAARTYGKKWLPGEHDIVVLHHKFGPIFLQVKAGHSRKSYVKAEKQLEGDKKATAAFLKRERKQGSLNRKSAHALFNYPGFVVMPNCSKQVASGDHGIFMEDCSSVDALRAWWDQKVKSPGSPEGYTQEVYELLAKRLVMGAWIALKGFVQRTNDIFYA